MKGKEKCKILKEIRKEIAKNNDIEFITSECKHKGDCLGTCPKCEAELRYLEKELEKRQRLGKAVTLAGLAVTVAASSTACDIFTTQGEMVDGDLPPFFGSNTEDVLMGVPPSPDTTDIITDMGEIYIPEFDYILALSEESAISALSYLPISEIVFYWDDVCEVLHDEEVRSYEFSRDADRITLFYDNETQRVTNAVICVSETKTEADESESEPLPDINYIDFKDIFTIFGADNNSTVLEMARVYSYTSYPKLWNEYIIHVNDQSCEFACENGWLILYEGENNTVIDVEIKLRTPAE